MFQTKTEWIYDELRRMISSGELPSGARLPLTQLAERFGTSEIPVREALRMLQQEGLVVIESHRGATVASVSWEQLYEAIVVRTYLEVLALREAAPRHTPDSLKEARAALEDMDELARSPSPSAPEEFSLANRRFHEALYRPGPYELLADTIRDLWDRVWRTRSQSLFYMEHEHMLRVQEDHREMLDAAERGDVETAEAAAVRHRDSNLRAWQRIIERATGTPASEVDAQGPSAAPPDRGAEEETG